MNESLAEIFQRHAGPEGVDAGHADKGTIHSYIEVYETLLAPYRQNASFMEIGLAAGWSLAMWQEYFGEDARILGADISIIFDRSPFLSDPRVTIVQADATKPEFLNAIGERTFDVIIDDGSHMQTDQVATFNLLKPRMRTGGLYIIEDILALDLARHEFAALHPAVQIYDRRSVKGRWDDVLIVYRF